MAGSSTTVRGTSGFMPLESLGFYGDPRSADHLMSDMWCLGETVFQTLTGRATFANIAELVQYQSGLAVFPEAALREVGASREAIDFIRNLMAARPWERPTAAVAGRHPWLGMEVVPLPQACVEKNVTPRVGTRLQPHDTPARIVDQLTQASGLWTTTLSFQPHAESLHTSRRPFRSGPSSTMPQAPVIPPFHPEPRFNETDFRQRNEDAEVHRSVEPRL